MPNELKMLMADELARHYQIGTDFVVVAHTKLSGTEITDLRKRLREQGVRMKVIKNSIAVRALEAGGLGEGKEFLQGPCAMMSGDVEMPELCKIIAECVKKLQEKLLIRGGVMDGSQLSPETVNRLAGIPSLPVLHAQIVSGFQAPIARMAAAFQSLLWSLARALDGIRKQKEGDAPPSAA